MTKTTTRSDDGALNISEHENFAESMIGEDNDEYSVNQHSGMKKQDQRSEENEGEEEEEKVEEDDDDGDQIKTQTAPSLSSKITPMDGLFKRVACKRLESSSPSDIVKFWKWKSNLQVWSITPQPTTKSTIQITIHFNANNQIQQYWCHLLSMWQSWSSCKQLPSKCDRCEATSSRVQEIEESKQDNESRFCCSQQGE